MEALRPGGGHTARRLRRRHVATLVLAVLLAIPAVALGNHQFEDVPDQSQFHTNISRAYGARITNGCGPGIYCPQANVTREQMAAFLTRTGGRAESSESWSTPVLMSGLDQTIASVTVRAGDITGGTSNVLVTASISGSTSVVTGCPCTTTVFLHDVTWGFDRDAHAFLQVDAKSSAGGFDSTSFSTVVAVPTGEFHVFSLVGFTSGGGHLSVTGNLTAAVFPFDGWGLNPAIPPH